MTPLVVAAFVHASTVSAVAAAPPADPEPVEARLEIDTDAAGPGAEVLRRRIEERANVVLRHAKVLPGDADDPTIVVSVTELAGDEPGYRVRFELRAGDGSTAEQPVELECRLCTETELVAKVEAELEGPIASLRELEVAAPEPEPELEPPVPEPAVSETVEPPRARAGMLAGGVALLAVGVVGLGAGVGLAVPEPRIDQDNPLDLISTRPVGYALLAGGAALAVTGAVVTALAVKQRSKNSLVVAPVAGRGHVGAVLGWRL